MSHIPTKRLLHLAYVNGIVADKRAVAFYNDIKKEMAGGDCKASLTGHPCNLGAGHEGPCGVAQCGMPPDGWLCTRGAGHEGPCAAVQVNHAHEHVVPDGGNDAELGRQFRMYFGHITPEEALHQINKKVTAIGKGEAVISRPDWLRIFATHFEVTSSWDDGTPRRVHCDGYSFDEFRREIESLYTALQADRGNGESVAGCNMGVGCDEAGVCYAMANGQPDRCAAPQAVHADGGKGAAVGYVNAQWANDRRGTTTIYAEPRPRLATFALYTAPQAECAHKFVPYYEGVQLCEKCKTTQAERAQPQPVLCGFMAFQYHAPEADGTQRVTSLTHFSGKDEADVLKCIRKTLGTTDDAYGAEYVARYLLRHDIRIKPISVVL